jgi:hypothetical protein
MANPGLSAIGWGIRGALANDKYGITGKRGEVGITENDVRDAMDYGGMFAGARAQAERDAQQASKEAGIKAGDTFGLGGPKGPNETTPDSPTDTESGRNAASGGYDSGRSDGGKSGDVGGDPDSAGSCFVAGTQISMANGTTKPIEEIRLDDDVQAWDEVSESLVTAKVSQLFVHPPAAPDVSMVCLSFDSGNEIFCTPDHPFLDANGEWVEAGALDDGTPLIRDEIVTKVDHVGAPGMTVYNFQVEGYHTYLAEGHVVHNKSEWKAGGVMRTTRPETKTIRWGEPGTAPGGASGETAIFIPEIMKRMGMQGREQEVIQALQTMLRILKGNQASAGINDVEDPDEDAAMGLSPGAPPVAPRLPQIAGKEKANGRRGN